MTFRMGGRRAAARLTIIPRCPAGPFRFVGCSLEISFDWAPMRQVGRCFVESQVLSREFGRDSAHHRDLGAQGRRC
jgi:hypothetical protein